MKTRLNVEFGDCLMVYRTVCELVDALISIAKLGSTNRLVVYTDDGKFVLEWLVCEDETSVAGIRPFINMRLKVGQSLSVMRLKSII